MRRRIEKPRLLLCFHSAGQGWLREHTYRVLSRTLLATKKLCFSLSSSRSSLLGSRKLGSAKRCQVKTHSIFEWTHLEDVSSSGKKRSSKKNSQKTYILLEKERPKKPILSKKYTHTISSRDVFVLSRGNGNSTKLQLRSG